ncbi:hypothetical protein TRIUR3_05239 [Triticum urartu]|uniref:RRM domain-containing protein n=2 Tax=Triticum TaxID=4564 RepID=A0A9R0ZPK2_TRITD|nr:hypothetical protein TRIUR3_05239 [Triticum urartu]VAI81603.1 unnamed protein product [Triticum turgidum subsp. durum]
MDTVEDAERCIKYLNQSELQGRNITVEKPDIVLIVVIVVSVTQRPPKDAYSWELSGYEKQTKLVVSIVGP